MNLCTKCGLQIEEGLNFCTNCGEAIHATDETAEMPDSIQNAPVSTPEEADTTPDEPAPTPYVPAPAPDVPTTAPTPYVPDPTPNVPDPASVAPDSASYDVPDPTPEMPVPPSNPSSDIPPHTPTHTPQYQAPPQKNELMADCLSSIAKTFTANPEDGAATVATVKSPAWAVIGALYVLIFALATQVLHYVIMRDFGLGGFAGQRFLNGFLTGILFFVGFACCVKLIFAIYKKDVSFLKAITIVAGCSITVSVIMVAAIIMSFISIWVAQLLMTLSTVAFHILVYSFIKSTVEFKNSPLWVYLGLIAALNILQHIIVNNVLV